MSTTAASESETAVIPIVDLTKTDDECIARIKQACETTGFFYLAGHGFEEERIDGISRGARDFFQLGQDIKNGFRAKEGEHPFGYQSISVTNKSNPDDLEKDPIQREQIKLCRQYYLTDHQTFMNKTYKNEKDENKHSDQRNVGWLSELGTDGRWREEVNAYFQHLSNLAQRLRHFIASSLELDPEYFDKLYHTHVELMDINYYHAKKSDKDLDMGLHPQGSFKERVNSHTDYGMLTFLMDQSPGLKVCKNKEKCLAALLDNEEEWIDVKPLKNHFIVNIGDMLERWTSGQYVSNLHRVVNASNKDKLSIAFFTDPNIASKLFDEMF
jgi:isopenicillin N synthase-like dioxygenase